MFLTGKTFTYNNKSSSYYGLFFANVNTTSSPSLGGDIAYKTLKMKRTGKHYRQDTDYNAPLEFDAEIITETKITQDTLHEINAWLFNQLDYKKLYIDDPDYAYNNVHLNCVFTNVERIEACMGNQGYGIYGFKVTIKCDAPWAWEDEQTSTYTSFSPYAVFHNISDCNDYMYPKIQIKTGASGGDITIQQVTDNNRLTTIKNLVASETVILTPYPKMVNSSILVNHYEDFNKKWLRFLVGENRFTVTGNVAELKIIYMNARVV